MFCHKVCKGIGLLDWESTFTVIPHLSTWRQTRYANKTVLSLYMRLISCVSVSVLSGFSFAFSFHHVL